ncbi:hypothetical protein EJC49_25405 [Aquibium carbonis]|uniref:Uncharacterized protein n=1 Tax=Aquibium carbonis TaxID=2495581 RepID=A0A429YB06_9HYPH|nr:hypothetical protein [Aquibium carbonis]RST78599.1 hypothetical protein EJC49_25405 [Aquibium carbonis]
MPPIQVRIGIAADGAAWCRIDDERPALFSSPSDLWREMGARQGEAVHLLPEGTEPTGESGLAAEAMAKQGRQAFLGGVLRADGFALAAPSRANAARSARVPGGGLILSTALAGEFAARLEGWRWDGFWSSDLAAVTHELCEPLCDGRILARRSADDPGEALRTDLLSPQRAGFRSYDPAAPTIVVLGACDASCLLYFDAFSRSRGVNLRFLRPSHPAADLGWLCAASAVVFVRGLAQGLESGVVDLMRAIGVPVYWFVDDDFPTLSAEYPSFAAYRPDRIASLSERISGIIVSTAPLGDALSRAIGFPADRIAVLGPRVSRYWPRPTRPAEGIGFIGGTFRGEALRRQVMPALAALGPLPRIVACDNLRPFLDGVEAAWEPFEPDFLTFLHRWQRRAPAVIVHPPGRTGNLPGKSDATILVAHMIGAVPVVPDETGYAAWGEAQGVVKVRGDGWTEALRHVLSPGVPEDMRGRLEAALAGEARASDDARPLLEAVGRPAPVGEGLFHERLNASLGSLVLAQAFVPARVRRNLKQRLRDSAVKRLGWLGLR